NQTYFNVLPYLNRVNIEHNHDTNTLPMHAEAIGAGMVETSADSLQRKQEGMQVTDRARQSPLRTAKVCWLKEAATWSAVRRARRQVGHERLVPAAPLRAHRPLLARAGNDRLQHDAFRARGPQREPTLSLPVQLGAERHAMHPSHSSSSSGSGYSNRASARPCTT